jgi:phage gp29-like protein
LSKILRPQAAYRWLLPQLAAITPQYIEMVLRGALAGNHVQAWELFDLMEDSSPRLLKNLNEVKRAVVGMDWQLFPWQEENEAPSESARAKARLVGGALRGMRPDPAADENDFNGTIYDVLDAWGKGQSVLEVDWEARETGLSWLMAPRATYWVHPTCVSWDMEGRLGLRLEIAEKQKAESGPQKYTLTPGVWQTTSMQPRPSHVAAFPPNKFLISICKARSGTALGGALLRPLAWWWCAANFSGDWLLNLAQIFGLPFRWASYEPSAPQGTIDAICAMLANMGSQAWAAFPTGTKLELKEPARTGEGSPQGDLLDRAEKQMDLLILGQTLTTDVSKQGGSRALGEVHAGVKNEVVRAAGNFSAGVINTQLIPSILRLNYGETSEAPEFRPVAKATEDARANAERDSMLLNAGMQMPKAWFYRRHGVPLPQAREEVMGGEL